MPVRNTKKYISFKAKVSPWLFEEAIRSVRFACAGISSFGMRGRPDRVWPDAHLAKPVVHTLDGKVTEPHVQTVKENRLGLADRAVHCVGGHYSSVSIETMQLFGCAYPIGRMTDNYTSGYESALFLQLRN
ncbi:MAG: hypothetical protein K0Q73_7704 [Paenibacillus sp.]|nr:hypothetical protein [Paenibacillus sp.]